MHAKSFDISIKDLSRIEGHTDLDVSVVNGRVEDAKLRINESKRFFRTASLGKPALAAHQLVSRICGTCSIAHMMGCILCVENALEVEPSEQTVTLRNLMMQGLNIRDHAMHLCLFCLPDVLGKDSVLDFSDDGREHELLHKAFGIKAAGNELSTLIGGRAVHAPFPQPGGFAKLPKNDELRPVAAKLRAIRDGALEFVEIFRECGFRFDTETTHIALSNGTFSYLGGDLITSSGLCVGKRNFREHLQKFVMPYSEAPGFSFQGKPYMVGALSRLNVNAGALHPDTRRDCAAALKLFPSKNVFHNNLAQAVEIVHCIDSAMDALEKLDVGEETKPALKARASEGTGVIEAPRGTLYYAMDIGADGRIRLCDIVIPTSQNQITMERDIGAFVQQGLDDGNAKGEIRHGLEKLIRAYDPCMSCATHFLRINWR